MTSARAAITDFLRELVGDARPAVTADLDAAALVEVHAQLALAQQRRRAGELLIAADQIAEGLRLAEEALAGAIATAALVVPDAGAHGTGTTLGALGAAAAEIAHVAAAQQAARAPRPERDADVGPAEIARAERALAAARIVAGRLAPILRTPRRRALSRTARIGALAGVLALVVAAVAWFFRPDDAVVSVRASASFDEGRHGARLAVDGDATTEWLLPSRTTGHIDIRFRPRRITHVTLHNARNGAFLDRASREVRVELHSGDRIIKNTRALFATFEAPPVVEIPIEGRGIDLLRVSVLSYHRAGGGLAEIRWR